MGVPEDAKGPTGEVEYLGRGDCQLRLDRVRVEPGEIETRAMAFPRARECVIVARYALWRSRAKLVPCVSCHLLLERQRHHANCAMTSNGKVERLTRRRAAHRRRARGDPLG